MSGSVLLRLVALAAVFAYGGGALAIECDPEFVSSSGSILTVAPTNDAVAGDTANLQCALDVATASGRHTSIRLAAGTFHTAQLVAKDFVGTIAGSGMGATVLTNLASPLPVTPVDMFLAEPGPENPWPSLVAFVGGEFSVSNLTIRITGEAPTTGWSIFGIEPPIKALAHAIVIVGARATARFSALEIEGAPAPDDPNTGLNLYNGIFFEGFLGTNDLAPIAGRFEVHGCVMRQLGSPAPAVNLRDADVTIMGNRFLETTLGGEVGDLDHVRYVFAGNQVDSFVGVQMGDVCIGGSSVCGFQASNVTVAGNAIRAFDGVEVFATFAPDMRCTIVGNDIDYDAADGGVAVVLGRRTRGCFVSTAGAVVDLGTDNRVVTHP